MAKDALTAGALGGKAIAVLLTVVLALMAWSPATIGIAFADDGEGEKAPVAVDGGAVADEETPEATQPKDAKMEASSDAENASTGKVSSEASEATEIDEGDSGNGGDAETPESEGDDSSDGSGDETPAGEGVAPSSDDAEPSSSDGGDDANGEDEAAADGAQADGDAQQDEDTQSAADDGEVPATPEGDKPQGDDSQSDGIIPEASGQVPATMGEVHPSVSVSAKVSSKPANGKTYGAGETIRFRVTVRNAGDVPLYSVRVSNLISGTVSAPVVAAGSGYTANGAVVFEPGVFRHTQVGDKSPISAKLESPIRQQ